MTRFLVFWTITNFLILIVKNDPYVGKSARTLTGLDARRHLLARAALVHNLNVVHGQSLYRHGGLHTYSLLHPSFVQTKDKNYFKIK